VIGATYLAQGRFSPPKDAEIVRLPGADASVIVARRMERKSGKDEAATSTETAIGKVARNRGSGMN
jgi:hypothetical protein